MKIDNVSVNVKFIYIAHLNNLSGPKCFTGNQKIKRPYIKEKQQTNKDPNKI